MENLIIEKKGHKIEISLKSSQVASITINNVKDTFLTSEISTKHPKHFVPYIHLDKNNKVAQQLIVLFNMPKGGIDLSLSQQEYDVLKSAILELKKSEAILESEKRKQKEQEARERGTYWAIFVGGDSHRVDLFEVYLCNKDESKDYYDDVQLAYSFPNAKCYSDINIRGFYQIFGDKREQLPLEKKELIIGGLYGDAWLISEQTKDAIIAEIENQKLVQQAKIDQQKDSKRQKFELAKEMNKPVELSRYTVECNDPNEECSCDIIIVYAMPDGSEKTERVHTY